MRCFASTASSSDVLQPGCCPSRLARDLSNPDIDLAWCRLPQDDPRFQLADPICTFVFALLVLFTTRLILQARYRHSFLLLPVTGPHAHRLKTLFGVSGNAPSVSGATAPNDVTVSMCQDISDILMERVPRHLDVDAIDAAMHRVSNTPVRCLCRSGLSVKHLHQVRPTCWLSRRLRA